MVKIDKKCKMISKEEFFSEWSKEFNENRNPKNPNKWKCLICNKEIDPEGSDYCSPECASVMVLRIFKELALKCK